ncbi:MAG: hypothetical protein V1918_04650 [Planctomycetota bacterium]
MQELSVHVEMLSMEGIPFRNPLDIHFVRDWEDENLFHSADGMIQLTTEKIYAFWQTIRDAEKIPASGLSPLPPRTRLSELGLTQKEARHLSQMTLVRGLTLANVRQEERPVLVWEASRVVASLLLKHRIHSLPPQRTPITLTFRFLGEEKGVLSHDGIAITTPRWTFQDKGEAAWMEFRDDFTLTGEIYAFLSSFSPPLYCKFLDMNTLRCDILAVNIDTAAAEIQAYCDHYMKVRLVPGVHAFFKDFDLAAFPFHDFGHASSSVSGGEDCVYDLFLARKTHPPIQAHLQPATRDHANFTRIPDAGSVAALVDRLSALPVVKAISADYGAEFHLGLFSEMIPDTIPCTFSKGETLEINAALNPKTLEMTVLSAQGLEVPPFLSLPGIEVKEERNPNKLDGSTWYAVTVPVDARLLVRRSGVFELVRIPRAASSALSTPAESSTPSSSSGP